MSKIKSIAGILDFFIPAEVLSAVLLVFTMENILDQIFSMYVPPSFEASAWVVVYLVGVLTISILNYTTADEDELDDLNEDLEGL